MKKIYYLKSFVNPSMSISYTLKNIRMKIDNVAGSTVEYGLQRSYLNPYSYMKLEVFSSQWVL